MGWRIYEPAIPYGDRAEIWDAVAVRRWEDGDTEGAMSARRMAEENRSL